MKGIAVFVLFYLAGVALEAWLNVPLPANVIGMILLAVALFSGVVKLEWIDRSSGYLLRHMGLFFVPAIVGTIAFADKFRAHWLYVCLGVIPGTLLVMAAAGLVTKGLRGKERSADESADLAG
mgnify:CR=1 FL=1